MTYPVTDVYNIQSGVVTPWYPSPHLLQELEQEHGYLSQLQLPRRFVMISCMYSAPMYCLTYLEKYILIIAALNISSFQIIVTDVQHGQNRVLLINSGQRFLFIAAQITSQRLSNVLKIVATPSSMKVSNELLYRTNRAC